MTYEPHQVSEPENAWTALFRRILTGVRDADWRRVCARCGYTGQTHVIFADTNNVLGLKLKCWRFKAKKETVLVRRGL